MIGTSILAQGILSPERCNIYTSPPSLIHFLELFKLQIHTPEAASYFFGGRLSRVGRDDEAGEEVSPAVDGRDGADEGISPAVAGCGGADKEVSPAVDRRRAVGATLTGIRGIAACTESPFAYAMPSCIGSVQTCSS